MQPSNATSGYFLAQPLEGVQWHMNGHRIHLSKDGKPIRMADLSEDEAVALASRIVPAYHAAHGDPAATFHGTAMHQLKDSTGEEWLMIGSNAQPLDEFNRSCAEMSTIWEMREQSKDPAPILQRSFLIGNYTESKGHENAYPCGHCRREMTAIAAPDAMFYSLPHSLQVSDDLVILPMEKRSESQGPTILSMKVADLLPLPKVRLPDASWVGTIAQAEQALAQGSFDDSMMQLIMKSIDGRKLEGPNTLELINQALVGAIADVHQRREQKPEHIRAVAVRNNKGEIFIMAMGQDEDAPSKPPVLVGALMKALNERNITDVYVMDYNPAQTKQAEEDVAAGKTPMIAALDGTELDRLYKHKPKSGAINVHILPFNDGTLSEQQLKSAVNSADLEAFYPAPYISPKAINCGAQPSAGRC